jgi:predicted TIM-barrel fold metal-dependent hydrolase
MTIVSVDDHLVEPPDTFKNHVPEKYADQAPRLIQQEDGKQAWVFQGAPMGLIGGNANVSWPSTESLLDPATMSEMRPGCYDIDERIRDMNANGVLASLCFPTMTGFSGRYFFDKPDKDLSLIMLQAYNDWNIDEWCAAYPGRLIPNSIPPVWDPQLLAAEVRRVAAKGCRAMSMPELPHIQGLPSYASDYWEPFFAAASETGVVMNLHIGQGVEAISMAPDSSLDVFLTLSTQASVLSVQDLLWGPALRKYPDLRISWSEGGIGWIPFMLDRVDRQYHIQKNLGQDFGDKLPSDVFREHALGCFISDPTTLKLHEDIGIDIIAFESDYPHSDCNWPDAPEVLWTHCDGAGISDADIEKIAWMNAARFYDFDPFKHVNRDRATVGALRALATDVDTAVTPKAVYKQRFDANPRFEVPVDAMVEIKPWHW